MERRAVEIAAACSKGFWKMYRFILPHVPAHGVESAVRYSCMSAGEIRGRLRLGGRSWMLSAAMPSTLRPAGMAPHMPATMLMALCWKLCHTSDRCASVHAAQAQEVWHARNLEPAKPEAHVQ